MIVPCPLAGTLHCKGCAKRRNLGSGQTGMHGQAEVYGFLGVWLKNAGQFASKTEHVSYRPSAADVESYLPDKGWIA